MSHSWIPSCPFPPLIGKGQELSVTQGPSPDHFSICYKKAGSCASSIVGCVVLCCWVSACLHQKRKAIMASAMPDKEEAAKSSPEMKEEEQQVISETKELVSSTVADAKDVASSRVAEVVDATREALHSGVEAAISAVTSSVGMVKDFRVSQVAVSRAEAVLEIIGEDDSLPLENEELAKLAASGKGADMSLEQQQQKRRYFVRLGSLSGDLLQFAYLHSKYKIKQVWQDMREALGQLNSIIDLIEVFRQGFDKKLQEKLEEQLCQMWLDWTRKLPEESEDRSSAKPEEMESLALLLARSITQQLQITSSKVVAAIQGLPSSLRRKLKHSFKTIEELHASFLAANSLHDLSSTVLEQSQPRLVVIYVYMEKLLDYLSDNRPLSWLVGPFSPMD
ncbi:perilipin-3-like isoform X2 [Coturnix japonica]|uniref:Perilipin-3-like n=1 Tax=Coturnix japonica TaxID=93934 RepID=A0A8C2UBV4_COTJA|nr:perilipin-3-like isoform X2 [Coturnix japonica]